MPENQPQKKADQSKSQTDDAGEAELQERFDKEDEQGYRGIVADPTPNSAYTVAGVTSGEPTPETDGEAARKADQYRVTNVDAPKRADVDGKGIQR